MHSLWSCDQDLIKQKVKKIDLQTIVILETMLFLFNLLLGSVIKYVGGGAGGFYKIFKKIFVAQETIDLKISWPSNFFRQYFMAPPINFSFLFKAYL